MAEERSIPQKVPKLAGVGSTPQLAQVPGAVEHAVAVAAGVDPRDIAGDLSAE